MPIVKIGRVDRNSLERTVGLIIDKDNIIFFVLVLKNRIKNIKKLH